MVYMQLNNYPCTFCCVNYSSLVSRCSKSVGKWKHFLVWTLFYFSPPSISLEVCWWVLLPWWPQGLVPGARVVPSLILRLPCTTALASFPGSSPAFQWHNVPIFPCNTCSLPPSSEATKVLQLYILRFLPSFFLTCRGDGRPKMNSWWESISRREIWSV